MSLFKRRRFPAEIILLCVRWYCRYGISYRDLEEMMAERGVAVIAEFERALIRQRTEEGRAAARKRGVPFGRPRKLRADQQDLVCRLIEEGRSVSDVARTFNVHPATIYRCLDAAHPL
jgi:DNA invertase Pin-like site-specific DNA recombinase